MNVFDMSPAFVLNFDRPPFSKMPGTFTPRLFENRTGPTTTLSRVLSYANKIRRIDRLPLTCVRGGRPGRETVGSKPLLFARTRLTPGRLTFDLAPRRMNAPPLLRRLRRSLLSEFLTRLRSKKLSTILNVISTWLWTIPEIPAYKIAAVPVSSLAAYAASFRRGGNLRPSRPSISWGHGGRLQAAWRSVLCDPIQPIACLGENLTTREAYTAGDQFQQLPRCEVLGSRDLHRLFDCSGVDHRFDFRQRRGLDR